jgi:P-type Ca2+ transporter type 2C
MTHASGTTDRDQARWHARPIVEVLSDLQVDPASGLGENGLEQRRRQFGENRLTPAAQRTALRRFTGQFNNLFIYLLLAAGVVTALLGEWLDSGVIFGVVVVIAVIGFAQEGRAERALEAVKGMLSAKAWVVRDGHRREVPAEELVPGDVVLLHAGDRVPADLRVIRAKSLQTQEAALTGESLAVEKQVDAVDERAALGDRASMTYAGTVVAGGQGTGVVVATGDSTEIGRISGMLSGVETLKTPLMQRMDGFSKVLTVAIIGLAAATFAVGVLVWGQPWGEMFFAAVSIAVAAIPEGLPAVMTVTLAIGVERMARRNAIIRRLPAVETLGAVTIICADKTGTLTRNEMTARTLRTADEDIEAEGVGYQPHGAFLEGDRIIELDEHPLALELVRAGLLCNDAKLTREDDEWRPEGDPTEVALVVLARKAGLDPHYEEEQRPRLDVIPFASERRYMATLHHDHAGNHFVYVKGAPERLLEMCSHEQRDGQVAKLDVDAWHSRVEAVAGRGQRLLAAARRDLHSNVMELSENDIERDLTLLGLFGLIDPPRDEAIEAVAQCRSAGIGVKMITGDHAITARAVARKLGLASVDEARTGREIDELDDEELRDEALRIDVFARASPENKLRLVTALQARNQVVAMTGDGVNDAPALKRANVGIAMGKKGTEAAREASEMVLADDNFASIQRAVVEGRTVYDNLKKAILFILPTNAAQALIIFTAILLGMVLPVTPVQILWVNMITAITLGIAFAWEQAEGDVMRRPPRRSNEPLLSGLVLWRIALVGLVLLAGVGFLFSQEQARDATTLAYARTTAVNALVMGQIFYLLNARFFDRPAFTFDGLFGSRVVLLAIAVCLGLQLLLTYVPFMNVLFGTEPLDAVGWMYCVGVGVAVFVLVEFEKMVRRGRRGSAA